MNATRCGHCNMRWSRCLCNKNPEENKVPDPRRDKAQTTLAIGEHAGSRVAYWLRWLNTEGVRLGLWVHPNQHQSSQDRCQSALRQDESSES